MAIRIDIKELYEIFEATPSDQNIMLVGTHGIGKSRIVEDYFTDKGMKVTALFLGQMSDPGDLIGLPRLNEETGKTDFMPPYWFPTDGEPIVLFLDELNRARPEMLQTVMDLVLNRKLAGRRLPEGSRIISAVNDGEEYQVGELDPALVSRFNIYNLVPTVKDWIKWATSAGLDERVITFIKNKPSMLDSRFDATANSLDKSPDRRAWERVARAIEGVREISTARAKMIAGIVGVQAASLFVESLKEHAVTGKDVLKSFDKIQAKLEELSIENFPMLNDDILGTLNSLESVAKFTPSMQRNLTSYIKWLQDTNRREAYAYFIKAFLNEAPVRVQNILAKTLPSMLIEFTTFIQEIEA